MQRSTPVFDVDEFPIPTFEIVPFSPRLVTEEVLTPTSSIDSPSGPILVTSFVLGCLVPLRLLELEDELMLEELRLEIEELEGADKLEAEETELTLDELTLDSDELVLDTEELD